MSFWEVFALTFIASQVPSQAFVWWTYHRRWRGGAR